MAITVTVDSTVLTPLAGTLTIDQTLGARHLCRFEWLDLAGAVLEPEIGDVCTVEDGATVLFGGLVTAITERGWGPTSLTHVVRGVTVTDYTALCDKRLVTETYASGQTLKQILADLVTTYLDVWGITLDAGQVDGPTFDTSLTWEYRPLTDVLNDLQDRTGYVWRISYAGVLTAYATGSLPAAPASITTSNGVAETLEWEEAEDVVCTRMYVSYGPSGTLQVFDSWTATVGQDEFPLHYTGLLGYRVASQEDEFGAHIDYPVGVYGIDSMRWTYDSATNTLYYDGPALSGGEAISFNITVAFPQVTHADAVGYAANPAEAIVSRPDLTDWKSAYDYAESLVGRSQVKSVTFTSKTNGWEVGQVMTITLPGRRLSGSHLITSVSAHHVANSAETLLYTVTCKSGTDAQGVFTETYRQWAGLVSQAASGTASTGSPASSSSAATMVADLGGDDGQSITHGDWTTLPRPRRFKCRLGGDYTFRHTGKTSNAGTEFQIRLYDETDSAAVTGSTSTASGSTGYLEAEATVTLEAGHRYIAQITGSNATYAIWCRQAELEL